MPFGIGVGELVVVLVIILIIFGVGKLPEIGGAMGKGIREFKKASSEVERTADEIKKPLKSEQTSSSKPHIPE